MYSVTPLSSYGSWTSVEGRGAGVEITYRVCDFPAAGQRVALQALLWVGAWGCREGMGGEGRGVGPIWEHSCWGEELLVNGGAARRQLGGDDPLARRSEGKQVAILLPDALLSSQSCARAPRYPLDRRTLWPIVGRHEII